MALDAVLDDLDRDRYDEIVCLGDVALRGPQPVASLERVRELGCQVVMGNTDEWLLTEKPSWRVPDANDPVMEIDLWCAGLLTDPDREVLRRFQPPVEMLLVSRTAFVSSTGHLVTTRKTYWWSRRRPNSKQ